MIASIHQPQYLPWPGFWDKMARSDVFILLDTVQFRKNEWQNRNRIKTPDNWQWLTVPVFKRFGQKIAGVLIDNKRDWRRKHRTALRLAYARAPYFEEHGSWLLEPLDAEWEQLVDINLCYIRLIRQFLGMETEVVLASKMGELPDEPTERLVAICRELGADVYLSGDGARDYLDTGVFDRSEVELTFQGYEPPEYSQQFGAFVEGLSAVDIIFNCGDRSLEVITSGGGNGNGRRRRGERAVIHTGRGGGK